MNKQKRKNDEDINFSSELVGCFEVALIRFTASVLALVCIIAIIALLLVQPFSSSDTLFMITVAGALGLTFGYLALYYGDTLSQPENHEDKST